MRITGKKSIFDIFDGKTQTDRIVRLSVDQIVPSRYQPRLYFDENALIELSESIKQQGLIQPITVRAVDDHYEIIAGERRFRACRLAGYKEVPCYVLSPDEAQAAEMALVENIQREDLSAIEEAQGYVQIIRQSSLTQEQLAKKLGRSQSSIANKIRLLNLPEEIQEGVMENKITERHARALLSLDAQKQKQAYQYMVEKNLTVRESEKYIETLQAPKKVHRRQKTKGFTRNTQLAINSVNQCVQMIRKLGIDAKAEQIDGDEEIRMIVHIPRK